MSQICERCEREAQTAYDFDFSMDVCDDCAIELSDEIIDANQIYNENQIILQTFRMRGLI